MTNNALVFDGKKTSVWVDGLALPAGGPYTIEFWIKPDPQVDGTILAFAVPDADGVRGIQVRVSGSALTWDQGAKATDAPRLTNLNLPSPPAWTNVVLVADGNGGSAVYVGGQSVSSWYTYPTVTAPPPGKPFAFKGLAIGTVRSRPNGLETDFYEGLVDELRIWSVARSFQDVQRYYGVQAIGDEPGLVASYSFNSGLQGLALPENERYGPPYDARLVTLGNAVGSAWTGTVKPQDVSKPRWDASGVALTAPFGPVYQLRRADGTGVVYTAKDTERAGFVAQGWKDEGIVFYACRAATAGTTPLYRYRNRTTNAYLLTVDAAERRALDPRKNKNQAFGDWVDEGPIAWVATSNPNQGDELPLYRQRDDRGVVTYAVASQWTTSSERDPAAVGWVIAPSNYTSSFDGFHPSTVSVAADGLSDQVWYLLVCRALGEDRGLRVADAPTGGGARPVAVAPIPRTGSMTSFQWRRSDGRLINRATGLALSLSGTAVLAQPVRPGVGAMAPIDWTRQSSDWKHPEIPAGTQKLQYVPVPSRGSDCFTLTQDGKALSGVASGSPSTVAATALGDSARWTFAPTEPVYGWTLPAPLPRHSARPLTKYLDACGVAVVGTSTVSDWAVLQVKLVVENMLLALKDPQARTKMAGKLVIVMSREDTAADLGQLACFALSGTDMFQGSGQDPNALRGMTDSRLGYCLVTEEMMAKRGVFNVPNDTQLRYFDQVVHEFAHYLDYGIGWRAADPKPWSDRSNQFDAQEDLAGSVQAWFNSSTVLGGGVWAAATRSALKQQFPGEYNYLAARFDEANTWVPLRPVRDQPHEPSPLDRLPTDNGAEFSFAPDVHYFADEGDYYLVMQSDGNLVLYTSTTAHWAAPTTLTWKKGTQACFTSDGTLVVRDGTGVSLWETPTKGNPGAQLSLTTTGSLQIVDVLGKVIWRSDAG